MLRHHTISIKNALNGVKYAFTTQPNYRIHLFCSILVLIAGWFLDVTSEEFLILIVMIILGLVIETINTAIEEATDAIDTKIREDLRIAKDVSAAAMLIFAVGSVAVAAIIFIPKLI